MCKINRAIHTKKIKHQRNSLLARLVKAGFCLNYLLTSVIHFSKRKKKGTISHNLRRSLKRR